MEFDHKILETLPVPDAERIKGVLKILKTIIVGRIMPCFRNRRGTDPTIIARVGERLIISRLEDDENRIGSAMDYVLMKYCDANGNSCITKQALFDALDELLMLGDVDLYEMVLVERVGEGSIVVLNEQKIAPSKLYDAEKYLYEEFKGEHLFRQDAKIFCL